MVIIKKNVLNKVKRTIPSILQYQNHINTGSLLNTPPVFAVYVSLLTLRWIIAEGGLEVMEQRAAERANMFYETLDALPAFTSRIVKEDRSLMNAVFTTTNPNLENDFLEACNQNGMVGVKGHRSVGGLRISMYNAMPLNSVKNFCELMEDFSNRHA